MTEFSFLDTLPLIPVKDDLRKVDLIRHPPGTASIDNSKRKLD